MKQYHDFLQEIIKNGKVKGDRTGTGTLSIFGHQMRFDLNEGFPLVTTKKVHFKSIVHELLWFISGNTNTTYLNDNGVTIWDEWKDENNDLGPIYGKQWRNFAGVDQLQELINQLRDNPDSRRHIVSAWNPAELQDMALPPCHCFFQFYVHDETLSCQLYQRSADAFLGVPFNIASYALLTHMIAEHCGYEVGDFIWTGGDCHIYANHIVEVFSQLQRTPYELPDLTLHNDDIFTTTYEDIELVGYKSHPAIKAEVAV